MSDQNPSDTRPPEPEVSPTVTEEGRPPKRNLKSRVGRFENLHPVEAQMLLTAIKKAIATR